MPEKPYPRLEYGVAVYNSPKYKGGRVLNSYITTIDTNISPYGKSFMRIFLEDCIAQRLGQFCHQHGGDLLEIATRCSSHGYCVRLVYRSRYATSREVMQELIIELMRIGKEMSKGKQPCEILREEAPCLQA